MTFVIFRVFVGELGYGVPVKGKVRRSGCKPSKRDDRKKAENIHPW
jgi:hypothetical protein